MMKSKIETSAAVFLALFIIAFLLNYVWETFHGAFLFQAHDFSASTYVPHLAYMAWKDALVIVALYAIVSLPGRDIIWVKKMDKKRSAAAGILGMVVAAIFEYRAVYVTHEWHYNEHMPLLFGIGVSPLIQLSATMLTALWVTRRVVFFNNSRHARNVTQ